MNRRKASICVAVLIALGIVSAGCATSNGDSQAPSTFPPAGSITLEDVAVTPSSESLASVVPKMDPNSDNQEDQPLQNSRAVEVDTGKLRQLLFQDAIPPIYDPEFISPADAALNPEELVIGVEINGEVRAYPIGPLVRREMVNDVVGGVPILVTW